MMAVMTIHISPFNNVLDPTLWRDPFYFWLGGTLNQLCRFAVPLFFLCAGYFLQPKLAGGHPLSVALRYCRPLLLLWLVWSLLYLLIPFNPLAAAEQGYLATLQQQWPLQIGDRLNVWLVGGMVHLWFLPALMLAVMLTALCHGLGRPALALWLGTLLYLLALIGGSYAKPLLGAEWPLLTRNGPLFSLVFVALGVWLRQRHWQPDAGTGWLLLTGGILLYALEAWALLEFGDVPLNRHDFLLGSLPWGVGLFGLLLAHPQLGAGSWLERLSPKVLGLYCLHMLPAIWLFVFGPQGKLPWWELLKLPLLFAASLLLYRILSTTPVTRWLLRPH